MVRAGSSAAQIVLVGTGSEVSLCVQAATQLEQLGIASQVVSMPSWDRFETMSKDFKSTIFPRGVPVLSVEAGSTFGWAKYADQSIGIDRFGASAPGNVVMHVKQGTMRMIGVASAKRMASLPDVPTIREQGIDVVQGGWTLIVAPKGLSAAQIAYWENLLERTVNHPEWKRSLEEDSAEWLFMKTQATRDFLKKEYDTDRALLVELGMVK